MAEQARPFFFRRTVVIVGLLFVGLLVRLYAAWCFRHNLNLDAGVVALMAKHVSEGTALPVFFYGQAYMGSLEVLFSGLFCRLFGVSGFAVCLGTVFVGFWLMPIVYLWARDAAGHKAGCLALIFVLIGPGGFFHYSASPRGGYAATLTLGAFLMWYSTRMAVRWSCRKSQSAGDFFLLGLAAGLAWWSNQLTAPAIFAAGVILLVVMRRALFTSRLLFGAGGFCLGSAPFWVYNVSRGWPSFAFAGAFHGTKFVDGLLCFFRDRLASLILPVPGSGWPRYAAIVLYIALAMFALILMIRAGLAGDRPLFLCLAGLLIFTVLFSVFYACSRFAAVVTPRYSLPMVAPIAVWTGAALAHAGRKVPIALASAPLLFLVALQTPVLCWARSFEQSSADQMKQVRTLGSVLAENELDALYARNVYRSWIFALQENCVFVDLENNFYLPHTQLAERSDRVAVLNNYGHVADFVARMGGSMESAFPAGLCVYYDIRLPESRCAPIPSSLWESAEDASGQNVMAVLTDGRASTYWERPAKREDDPLTIAFKEPVVVSGFRAVASHFKGYPFHWSAEGRTPDGDWVELSGERPFTRYYQSGPRPFWGGAAHRLEARFAPVELTGLRLIHRHFRGDFHWSIHTLQIFEPSVSALPGERESIEDLLRELRKRNVRRLYADRWAANKIHFLSGGEILTTMDPHIFPDRPVLAHESVSFSDGTAMLVRAEDSDLLRRSLERRRAAWSEAAIGPWIIFCELDAGAHESPGLRWVGFGALADDNQWATLLAEKADARMENNVFDETTLELLDRALEKNPLLYKAMQARLLVLTKLGRDAEAASEAERLGRMLYPSNPALISYAGRLRFLGYETDRKIVAPGESFLMTYHWECPTDFDFAQFAVFVHFKRDGIVFQDDHVLMSDLPRDKITSQPGVPVIVVEREIHVPDHAESGPLEIFIGLYDRRDGQRLRPRTHLPVRRRGIIIPDSLVIGGGQVP